MKTVALILVLAAAFELLWASHRALRANRAHFRAMVLLFWGLTALVWAGNAWGLLPAGLYHNGVPRFASDAVTYQTQATYVADGLRIGVIAPYVDSQVFNYSRVLGVLFYLFDDSRLAAGLFNVTFYMASVLSVFFLGRRLFDDRAGLWAAWLAACWPIFLLYETQTLRWVSTTAALHLVMAGTVLAMGRDRVCLPLMCGLAGFAILLVDFPQFARIAYMVAFTQAAVLLAADLRIRAWPIRAARVAAMALVMLTAYDLVWVKNAPPPPSPLHVGKPRPVPGEFGQAGLPEHLKVPPPRNVLDRLIAPILSSRNGYLRANEESRRDGISVGTTLDGRPLLDARDFFANLPTALTWAILVPTPWSLLNAGSGASQLGRSAAVEAIAYYVLFVMMCLGLKQALFRNVESMLATIYILIFTGIAYVIIGTVTMNGGTLHRFRLPYVVIHMVYAAPVLAAWVPALIQRVTRARR